MVYWTSTAIAAWVMAGGGVSSLLRVEGAVKGFTEMGYPTYLLTIIGTWKVLGAAAILAPGAPRLKEWAYAGMIFDLTGGVFSHFASGQPLVRSLPAFTMTLLVLASWAFRPSSRRLGALLVRRASHVPGTTGMVDVASGPG
jgi:hypothetical protein